MAKRFAGFTPEQLGRIDPSLAGKQSDEQQAIIAANPALAARLGKMTQAAQKRVEMAYGGYVKGFAEGGVAEEETPEEQTGLEQMLEEQRKATEAQAAAVSQAGEAAGQLTQQALTTPETVLTPTEAVTTTEEQKAAGEVATGTGQITTPVQPTGMTTAQTAMPVTAPTPQAPALVSESTVGQRVEDTVGKLVAATGKPSAEALAEAAQMNPTQLAQLGLTVEQIQEAQQVQAPAPREMQEGEMISGSTVDMERVRQETNFEAATGAPSTDATVQGQLTKLMSDFEGKEPPAWAAGAMRSAAAQMAARGLTASSMAGQALVQAAMESALPIASRDAQTVAQFEAQNLSNRQQTAMFAAQQRAEFLGLEFNQEFQSRVANAAKISEIANINFSAEQQVALENARLAQTVDITNLNAANAKVMADAAAMSQLDMANLNNRQQAQVQAAQAFLQTDMANLNNEQQTKMFKSQSMVNAMLSDQAAENAAAQFNASSENQVNQFFADLGARVQLTNAEQMNLMSRFNAGEANALAQFDKTLAEQREQFNAANRLVVAQANAKWAQSITTADNAAQNQANRDNAQRQSELSTVAYNNTIQQYRDLMSYAWKSGDNDAQRAVSIAIAQMQTDASKYSADISVQNAKASAKGNVSAALWGAAGSLVGKLI
jgi:hypothetical protein